MKYIIGSLFTVLFVAGCTSLDPNTGGGEVYMHNGINFGYDRDTLFKKGVQDACRTADGYYTKNRKLFNTNISYKTGWEDGRLQCKGK
ncbi:MAG TPA: hypothetical protein EYH42_07115 [Sulfurovum sp.]|nr:hypothetical protein [Sulfurovum sp.]